MLFDIHSHIIPGVDDGSSSLSETVRLLEMMREQKIDAVIATPHFYPQNDNLEDFFLRVDSAYNAVRRISEEHQLPDVYLGCEMLYFDGIGSSTSLSELCLNGSDVLLLELTDQCIGPNLFRDLKDIKENLKITPIIAHVERYCMAKNYRKLIKFLKKEKIAVQINASSVLTPSLYRIIKRLLRSGICCVIATDAHSVEYRPPLLHKALNRIGIEYGNDCRTQLIKNAEYFYDRIVVNGGVNSDDEE
ncbi:MAG: hypothetical protein IKD04_01435 [Clostridia bacterium]|nr:hypothetical protein [Clostridia bacterium]